MSKKVILSLCGGGMRGVFTARILKRLSDALFEKNGRGIYDNVDMFVGTSIGSMLAAGIVYEKKTGTELDELFNVKNANLIMKKNIWDYIFGYFQMRPMYDGKGKRKFIENEFTDVSLQLKNKYSIFTGYNNSTRTPLIFKSWEPQTGTPNGTTMDTLHDILDLSSAAPSYFPSVLTKSGIIGMDGGVFANNPCLIAYSNALKLFGENSDIRILSIGTGIKLFNDDMSSSLKWGAIPWITKGNLIDRILDAPEDEVHNTMNTLTYALNHKYCRINPVVDDLPLDNTTERYIKKMKKLADEYWEINKYEVLKLFD